ncbi:hypothetical protein J6S37_02600 [Candidatus Saccharibacteria bacterium]|nr:hypothetical protein [Candidatus Saccharibacteria bacterium]
MEVNSEGNDMNSKRKIYLAHSTDMDYVNELYKPLEDSDISLRYDIILPHKASNTISNTREDYSKVDIVIAECSKPSTGVGIELGWFYDDGKPIYCFIKSGLKLSNAALSIAKEVIEYKDGEDFVNKVKAIIEKN